MNLNLEMLKLFDHFFKVLDGFIDDYGVYLYLVFVWLCLLAIVWILSGSLRRKLPHRNPSLHCMSPGSVSRYSSPCFPLRSILTRRPAPEVWPLRFRAREDCHSQFIYFWQTIGSTRGRSIWMFPQHPLMHPDQQIINHRRGDERQHHGNDQRADDGDAQRLEHLRAGAGAPRQRQHA
jgi:hypothetical protein